jgi:hypothetical protein
MEDADQPRPAKAWFCSDFEIIIIELFGMRVHEIGFSGYLLDSRQQRFCPFRASSAKIPKGCHSKAQSESPGIAEAT